jgi:ubiquinone/menaquinone biosynthesis C-methylase UbiE
MPKNLKTKLFDINLILRKIAVHEGETVAELGCGHFGHFVFPVAKLIGKSGTLYAVDVLPSVLDEIKKRAHTENLPQIKTVWSNLEIFKGTAIESSSVDTALLINTLNQSEKKLEILRETVRLLKQGGKLLIVDWKSDALLFGPKPEHRLKIEALRQGAPKLSLTIIEEFEVGEHYHAFLLKKM